MAADPLGTKPSIFNDFIGSTFVIGIGNRATELTSMFAVNGRYASVQRQRTCSANCVVGAARQREVCVNSWTFLGNQGLISWSVSAKELFIYDMQGE